ncbi:hypothetical protein KTR9_0956 [Gordonia sp. KTR9]|nr:hypothetical protein KTR9_0956 [Gordonia sp. KTR9]
MRSWSVRELGGVDGEAGVAQAVDEGVAHRHRRGQHPGAFGQPVAVEGQCQCTLGEHHRGGLVPGVALGAHPSPVSSAGGGPRECVDHEISAVTGLFARSVTGFRQHAVEDPTRGAEAHRPHERAGADRDRAGEQGRHRGDAAHAHRLRVVEVLAIGVVQQRIRPSDDPGVVCRHEEGGERSAQRRVDLLGVDDGQVARLVGQADPRHVARAARQCLRVEHEPPRLRVTCLLGDDPHGVDRAAGDPAAHRRHHEGGVGHLAGVVVGDLLVQRVGGDVGRYGVEAAGVDDACPGGGGDLVDLVDGVADERDLAGQIDVVGAGGGRRHHEGLAVLEVGTHGGADDLGARDHGVERRGRLRVGDDQRPVVRSQRQSFAGVGQLRLVASRECDLRADGRVIGQIPRREFTDEAAGAVDDDVEFATVPGGSVVGSGCAVDVRFPAHLPDFTWDAGHT